MDQEHGEGERSPCGEAHPDRLRPYSGELYPVWDPRVDRERGGGAGPLTGATAAETDLQTRYM